MRNKGRIVYSILCLLLFFLLPLSDSIKVYAATWGSVELTGESAVLMDADTGAILFSKNGEGISCEYYQSANGTCGTGSL